MSSLYNTDEAKVSYGFIGLGGVLGGACGGSITEFFVTRIGESYLLFISGFLLFCCILITEKLFSIHDSSDSVEDKIVSRPASGVGESNETSTLELFRDPYVRLIAGIVLFMTMAGTIFDFQLKTLCQQDIYKEIPFQDLVNQVVDSTISPLNSSAETSKAYSEDLFKDAAVSIREDISKAISGFRGASIDRLAMDNIIDGAIGSYLSRPGFSTLAIHPSPDVVAEVRKKFTSTYTTQYFGWLFKKVSLLSLLVQAFLTARFHQTIGVPLSLLVLPVLSMIDLSFLFLFPVLATISIATIIQNGLSYSLMQSSKEQLFIPTSDTVRYRAKSMIDTFVFRFGDAMASILILLVTRFFGYGLRELSLVNILIVSVWIFVVFRCGKKYISRL
jgi:ATP/ADP translocase